MPSGAGAGIANGSDVEALARGAPILQEGPPSWLYRPPRGAGARSPPMPPLRSAIGQMYRAGLLAGLAI